MERPFNIPNAKDDEHEHEHESEEILDLLPPRIREISGSSTAMESFNWMNDDLISHRIIPTLDSRLRTLIFNARSGLIANRLRHLVDAAPPSPPQCNLLFRVIPKMRSGEMVREMKFIECLVRDKRLSAFPQHEFTALTIPHEMPPQEFPNGRPHAESFVEAIGNKIIFWNLSIHREDPFCYILNSGRNSDRSFRALDTSTIAGQLDNQFSHRIRKVAVGDRLIVLLGTDRLRAAMLSLDVNSEKWSVLPECPRMFNVSLTPIPWKGKLYLVDINIWVYSGFNDTELLVTMHFDFQSNVWVEGGEENTTFARLLTKFPRSRKYALRKPRKSPKFLVANDIGRCMISSKSGTLYAIFQRSDTEDVNADFGEYPIGDIYAMDDLATGWRRIETRKSEHTQRFDPFKLPKLPKGESVGIETRKSEHTERYDPFKLPKGESVRTRTNCWEINEHDILLVVLHSVSMGNGLWARYAWWTFNKDDGVKNYGYEVLNGSALKNASDISLLKIEM